MNRIYYYIRKSLFNNNLNRENFTKSILNFNNLKAKNKTIISNNIIRRKMSSSTFKLNNYSTFGGNGGPSNFIKMIVACLGFYVVTCRFENNK
jgi:hypothetical protein